MQEADDNTEDMIGFLRLNTTRETVVKPFDDPIELRELVSFYYFKRFGLEV